jgi:hypothetical protein
VRLWKGSLRESVFDNYFNDMFTVSSLHLKCAALDPRFAYMSEWFLLPKALCDEVWVELFDAHLEYQVHLRAKQQNVPEERIELDDNDRMICKGTFNKIRKLLEAQSCEFKVMSLVLGLSFYFLSESNTV